MENYLRIRQTLLQYANNYEALSHQFVNVIPGVAQNAGPTAWSRLTPRVYARLTGGNVYGATGNLEIRVLPRSAPSVASTGYFQSAAYNPSDNALVAQLANDLADVPIGAMIAYPNAQNMQGLSWTPSRAATFQTPAFCWALGSEAGRHLISSINSRKTRAITSTSSISLQTGANLFFAILPASRRARISVSAYQSKPCTMRTPCR
jgi:hypothetical protein